MDSEYIKGEVLKMVAVGVLRCTIACEAHCYIGGLGACPLRKIFNLGLLRLFLVQFQDKIANSHRRNT